MSTVHSDARYGVPFAWAADRLRLYIFLCGAWALNYTLLRPSPVDVLFLLALTLTPLTRQIISTRFVVLLLLLTMWIASLYASSINLIDNPGVGFQLLALTFVILLGLTACLVTTNWTRTEFEKFIRVYVYASSLGAILGIIGYAFALPDFLWADRAKAFLDDPNMYGAFLIPGIFGSFYMLNAGYRRKLFFCLLFILVVGVLVSFSRVAIVAAFLWGSVYLLILNRERPRRALGYIGLILALGSFAFLISLAVMDDFMAKFSERATLAKDYDAGHGGRYSRYLLVFPFILDHPLGMGLFEYDRYFPEPIHNIVLSSFVNYGWLAGAAFLGLIILSAMITYDGYKRTRSGIILFVFFSWLAILSCALLHQSERWRHMWLFTGLIWGFSPSRFETNQSPDTPPVHFRFSGS